ncbi:NAD-dependent epimerase/dehydratase family protein [Brucellaceae bacterium D45D]
MKRIVLTGASGNIGRALLPKIRHLAAQWVLTDIHPGHDEDGGPSMENHDGHIEFVLCDLADQDRLRETVRGADCILHFGGIASEAPFDDILEANIRGTWNLYEAARLENVPRVVFASTNHVVGYYPQTERISPSMPMKPDGLYAASKCYGEALAQLYYNKFSIQSAIIRIGACWEKPTTVRMLSLWLSFDDLARLIERVVTIPHLGCPVVFAASANDAGWWDNAATHYLGWKPQNNAEIYRKQCEQRHAREGAPLSDQLWQGGRFTDDPIVTRRNT